MTLEEMQEFLMNETDHKVINDLLRSGTEWELAVKIAYETEISKRNGRKTK